MSSCVIRNAESVGMGVVEFMAQDYYFPTETYEHLLTYLPAPTPHSEINEFTVFIPNLLF